MSIPKSGETYCKHVDNEMYWFHLIFISETPGCRLSSGGATLCYKLDEKRGNRCNKCLQDKTLLKYTSCANWFKRFKDLDNQTCNYIVALLTGVWTNFRETFVFRDWLYIFGRKFGILRSRGIKFLYSLDHAFMDKMKFRYLLKMHNP